MFPEFQILRQMMAVVWARLGEVRASEKGYSTEAVIVTALLVALALTAVGVIAAKVVSKANSINTGS